MSAAVSLPSRRDVLRLTAAGAGMSLLAGCGAGSSGRGGHDGKLRALFMKQAAYSVDNINAMTRAFEKKNPGITVAADFVAYEALHDKIVTSAPAGTYDVVLMDVIWPAEFASKRLIKNISSGLGRAERARIFTGALQSAAYKNRYYGLPWILDTEYLFYNKRMLAKAGAMAPPRSWDDLLDVCRAMKAKSVVRYPMIWKAAQGEELICDYGALVSAFGGTWFDARMNPTFNTGGGLKALEFMRSTFDEGLANPSSLTSNGDDCRKAVSHGSAAMCLNWTYMYALANDPKESQVAGQVGIAHTPVGPAGGSGINGSMALAITSTSKAADAALKYVQYLTSRSVQNKYAQLSLPIWKSSYDASVSLDAPKAILSVAKTQLGDMALRPQVPSYNAVSHSLQAEIQNALSGKKSPRKALDDAAANARSLIHG